MHLIDVLLVPPCAAIAVCVGVLRARTRLLIGLFLAVPLWYVSVAGFAIPLYVIWMLLCLPAALLGFRRNPDVQWFGVAVAGIAVLYAVYAPFAVDGRQAVYLGAFYLCFLTGLLDAGAAVRDDENLHDALRRIAPLILLQCALVIVFRVDPHIEREFLRSPLLSLSAGEVAARGLFRGSPNNVLDADKAGGLLVNGNTASMVMGVAACLALWQWSRSRRRSDLAVAAVALVAVAFTGSKTGIVLAVATLGVVLFSRLLVRSAAVFVAVTVTVVLCVGAAVLTVGDLSWTGDVRRESALTLGIRQHIWHAAWQFFQSAPLTGLTPGGWERSFAAVAGARRHRVRLPAAQLRDRGVGARRPARCGRRGGGLRALDPACSSRAEAGTSSGPSRSRGAGRAGLRAGVARHPRPRRQHGHLRRPALPDVRRPHGRADRDGPDRRRRGRPRFH